MYVSLSPRATTRLPPSWGTTLRLTSKLELAGLVPRTNLRNISSSSERAGPSCPCHRTSGSKGTLILHNLAGWSFLSLPPQHWQTRGPTFLHQLEGIIGSPGPTLPATTIPQFFGTIRRGTFGGPGPTLPVTTISPILRHSLEGPLLSLPPWPNIANGKQGTHISSSKS